MTRKQRRDRRKKIMTLCQKNRRRNKVVKMVTSSLINGSTTDVSDARALFTKGLIDVYNERIIPTQFLKSFF